jgi:hypothetical protein
MMRHVQCLHRRKDGIEEAFHIWRHILVFRPQELFRRCQPLCIAGFKDALDDARRHFFTVVAWHEPDQPSGDSPEICGRNAAYAGVAAATINAMRKETIHMEGPNVAVQRPAEAGESRWSGSAGTAGWACLVTVRTKSAPPVS